MSLIQSDSRNTGVPFNLFKSDFAIIPFRMSHMFHHPADGFDKKAQILQKFCYQMPLCVYI